jgi:tetratricopeptide (TPR) repeat protein
VAELATACGHLPLALRIAAANLVDHPERTVASYIAELTNGDTLSVLTVEGDEGLAIRVAFDHSYASLVPEDQRLFHHLGIAPGPEIAAWAVAALADCSDDVAQRRLDRLAATHLVEPNGADRFVMHDLVRSYAQQKAIASVPEPDRTSALSRLLSLYLRYVDAAAALLYPSMLRLPVGSEGIPVHSNAAAATAWLEREHANLVAAVVGAAESGLPEKAWALADALRGYFWLRRHMVDWMIVANAALAAARSVDDPAGQSAAHLSLATFHLCQGRYEEATEQYALALVQSERAGWDEGGAAALGGTGTVCLQTGKPAEAASNYLRALAINRRLGRTGSQAMNLSNLGLVYLDLGRVREAADALAEVLDLQRDVGSVSGQVLALCNLGEANRLLGHLELARTQLSDALSKCQEIGYTAGEAVGRTVLAAIERDADRYDISMTQAQAALTLTREMGDRSNETEVLSILGSLHCRTGRYASAADLYQQALTSAKDRGATYQQADALVGVAEVCLLRGALEDALTNAHLAVELAARHDYRLIEARARTLLGEINHSRGNMAQAQAEAEAALDLHVRVGHRSGESRTRLLVERLRAGGVGSGQHSDRGTAISR